MISNLKLLFFLHRKDVADIFAAKIWHFWLSGDGETAELKISGAGFFNGVEEFFEYYTMTAWYFHGALAYVISIYGIYFYGIYWYGTYFYKAKKN